MVNQIKFLTDDEREQAEAFVKLTELGEISCLPGNIYDVSDETFTSFLIARNDFPDFEVVNSNRDASKKESKRLLLNLISGIKKGLPDITIKIEEPSDEEKPVFAEFE